MLAFGESSDRYTFSFAYAAIIILSIKLLASVNVQNKQIQTKFSSILILMLIAGILIGSGGGLKASTQFYEQQVKRAVKGIQDDSLVSNSQEATQYLKMQQSVPPGETILTRLEKPFLLDFSRNQIFIADAPGFASPPPGMPLFEGSEALSEYLTAQSIRYVAYAYGREPGAQRKYWVEKLGAEIYPWTKPNRILEVLRPSLRSEIQYALDFHENLSKLGKTRKKVYDDGEIFVIDLLNQEPQSNFLTSSS